MSRSVAIFSYARPAFTTQTYPDYGAKDKLSKLPNKSFKTTLYITKILCLAECHCSRIRGRYIVYKHPQQSAVLQPPQTEINNTQQPKERKITRFLQKIRVVIYRIFL